VSVPTHRAFPFKPDDLTRAGPNRTPVEDLQGFRWFIENRVRRGPFYYTQRPKVGDVFILAWSEGRLPWTALGEGVVQSCRAVEQREGGEYPYEIVLSEVKTYEPPKMLPERGRYILTLTEAEYAEISTASPPPAPVVFARIGWMTRYDGPATDDPRPQGGGSYTRREIGNEVFTFQPLDGIVYGYIQVPGGGRAIDLSRIIGSGVRSRSISGVTVVWFAGRPEGGQVVVGWYHDAEILDQPRGYPEGSGREDYEFVCRGNARDAVLLPAESRTFLLPSRGGGLGRSNILYPFDDQGESRIKDPKYEWMWRVVAHIRSYRGGVPSMAEPGAGGPAERGQGFADDAEERRLVDSYAMERAIQYYTNEGYEVHDEHQGNPYDLRCVSGVSTLFVEMKGTRT
jgi:hypothetical protein